MITLERRKIRIVKRISNGGRIMNVCKNNRSEDEVKK